MQISPFCLSDAGACELIGEHEDTGPWKTPCSSPSPGRKNLRSRVLETHLQHLQKFSYCADCLAYLPLVIIFLSKVLDRKEG